MIFTTLKKRVEKEELFPNDAVMTLVDNKFSLNKKAMELFGFPLNTTNTSKIANGYDDSNNILLTNMDTKDMYTNNVTAKNDFSSQLLANRLAKQFKLNASLDNHFYLNLTEDDGAYKYVGVEFVEAVNVPEEQVTSDEQAGFYPFVESTDEDIAAIEAIHAEDIAQIGEVIKELPSVCAEVLPEPPAEVIIVDTKEEHVGSGQVIPAEIVKKVINTDSW